MPIPCTSLRLLPAAALFLIAATAGSRRTRAEAMSPDHAQPPAATTLRWMAGCWQARSATTITDEQWMTPAGGALIGMSRTVSGERLRSWEALRVVPDSGRLTYIAQPNGGPATRFAGTTLSDTLAVFENPAHDFPQRIAYRRVGADSLIARISAERGGTTRGMDIGMRRVSCTP